MINVYFRPFNFICNLLGFPKPIITSKGKIVKINVWLKLWSVLITVGLISSYSFAIHRVTKFNIKKEMEMIPDILDLFANTMILIINLLNSEEICLGLHEMLDEIFKDLNFDSQILKFFGYKMYLWYFTLMFMFIILIILEIVSKYPPFILLIRIPTFLTTMQLIMHMLLLLAVLKVVNNQISRTLIYNDNLPKMIPVDNMRTSRILKYVFSPSIQFINVHDLVQFDLKIVCKLYDNLSTCIHLLEKCYGLQIFLSIWLMFTSGVFGVTVIVSNQMSLKWLVIVKSILPFLWCSISCYINDKMNKEVDQTITLIIKCLIDFRCVQTKKPVLETFKELVSNDRLQFTACSLFHLSYSMLFSTIINVITYSIILIQMV